MSQYDYVYGLHAVEALLANSTGIVKKICLSEACFEQKRYILILDWAQKKNIPIKALNKKKMDLQFAPFAHQGIVACVEKSHYYSERDLDSLLDKAKSPSLILILDGLTDPHNLGACLRTADATAVDFVVIPKDRSASLSPVVSKVASGAADSISLLRATNLVRVITKIKEKGIWVYGTTENAKRSVYNLDCKLSLALIMGSEGNGLRHLTKSHCDELISLPMLGKVPSLNVSVATGILLYEIRRQQGFNGKI